MSKPEVSRILFWAPNTLFDDSGRPVELMPELCHLFSHHLELAAVLPADTTHRLTEPQRTYPEVAFATLSREAADHGEVVRLLSEGNQLRRGTLYVDHDGKRCIAAFREGAYVSVFEDALRFYRDLGAWGIVPLKYSLQEAKAILSEVTL